MARKPAGQFSAASMADIAFLLLIFFLVATTMDIDTGLYTIMSPLSDDPNPPEIKERNVWAVLVNSNDQLMVEGKELPLSRLKEETKEFLRNPQNKENLPEKRKEVIDRLGEIEVTKGIISLKNDRNTTYGMFIKVKNELLAAGREVKDEFSMKHFGKNYNDLSEDLQSIVKKAAPAIISESEPTDVNK
jgi:biopolymer transport protein ExbD